MTSVSPCVFSVLLLCNKKNEKFSQSSTEESQRKSGEITKRLFETSDYFLNFSKNFT